MAATYEPIATNTLGSAATSYTFTSIPATYTDLILVFNGAMTIDDYVLFQVGNGSVDTATNYSATRLVGTGSVAQSSRSTGQSYIQFSDVLTTNRNNFIANFQNYANTTTYKTVLVRTNATNATVCAGVGLWRSTAAINTIKVYTYASQTFAAGTTFTLYGIKAA